MASSFVEEDWSLKWFRTEVSIVGVRAKTWTVVVGDCIINVGAIEGLGPGASMAGLLLKLMDVNWVLSSLLERWRFREWSYRNATMPPSNH